MKIFFWILVAVNVIFFAVMKSGLFNGGQDEPAPIPLHAEQILVAAQSAPVAVQPAPASAPASAPVPAPASAPAAASAPVPVPASAPAAAIAAPACYEWGEFSGAEINKASMALRKLHLGGKLSRHDVSHAIGYWVYIPPLKDKALAAQKVAELKSLGVTDYFVVQDAGVWLNAISLGVFKTQEAAQSFLEGLKAKGVHSAKIGEKSASKPAVMFELSGLNKDEGDKLTALQKDFSEIELKRVSCH